MRTQIQKFNNLEKANTLEFFRNRMEIFIGARLIERNIKRAIEIQDYIRKKVGKWDGNGTREIRKWRDLRKISF